jgi:hypothetical protein
MEFLYIALGIIAVVVFRIAVKTHKNLKSITEGEKLVNLKLASLREKGHSKLAEVEERKLVDKSYANEVYLNTGRSYALITGFGSNSATERYAEHMALSLIVKNSK